MQLVNQLFKWIVIHRYLEEASLGQRFCAPALGSVIGWCS